MLQITIREYTNAFGVEAYDTKDFKQLLSETHEERLSALKAVSNLVLKLEENELKLRGQYASAL